MSKDVAVQVRAGAPINIFSHLHQYYNGTVHSIKIRSDGKILVGGQIDQYGGASCGSTVLLTTAGSLESSFGSNTTQRLSVRAGDKVVLIVNAYVMGSSGSVWRVNADSTGDGTFSAGSSSSDWLNALDVQTDEKVIIGGNFTTFKAVARNRITRLNSDGTNDAGFTIGTGFDNSVRAVALQSDGKILVGGNFANYNGTGQSRMTRLNSDATRDTGFTIGTGFNGTVNTVLPLSDGKILVGGDFTTYNGTARNRLIKLNADGSAN